MKLSTSLLNIKSFLFQIVLYYIFISYIIIEEIKSDIITIVSMKENLFFI